MSTVPPTRPTEDLERLQALAESGAAELGWDAPAEAVVDWAGTRTGLWADPVS